MDIFFLCIIKEKSELSNRLTLMGNYKVQTCHSDTLISKELTAALIANGNNPLYSV